MRNEIYEKISQSRKRYLSELNQKEHQSEIPQEKPSEDVAKEKSTIDTESITIQLGEWVKSKNLKWEIKNSFLNTFKKIPLEGIKEKLNKLSNGIQQKLMRTNQKFTSRSDKFMEGFVSYSNRIFEDRYESTDVENSNMGAFKLQTTSSRQIVWELEDTGKNQEFIPPFSESQLGYFLKRIENTFIKAWKNFRFSIEFDGASLEYVNETGNEPMRDERKQIKFVQISEIKDTILYVPMMDGIQKQSNRIGNKLQGKLSESRRTKQFFHKPIHLLYHTGKKKIGQLTLDKLIVSILKLPFSALQKKSPATRLQGLNHKKFCLVDPHFVE
jgi:hypothetical protein